MVKLCHPSLSPGPAPAPAPAPATDDDDDGILSALCSIHKYSTLCCHSLAVVCLLREKQKAS